VLRKKRGTPDAQLYFEEQLTSLHEKIDEIQCDSALSKGYAMTMERRLLSRWKTKYVQNDTISKWSKCINVI